MIDLGGVIADHGAKERGLRRRDLWLDPKTCLTLKDVCSGVITTIWGSTSPLLWQRLSERQLECRFGRVRTSFGNAQVSICDYWRSSLRLMRKDLDKKLPEQTSSPKPISEEQFVQCGERAWRSVKKLMVMCTGKTDSQVQSIFNMALAHGLIEVEEDNDETMDAGQEQKGFVITCVGFFL